MFLRWLEDSSAASSYVQPSLSFENDAGEIVLGVEETGTQGSGNGEWHQEGQHQRQPAKAHHQCRAHSGAQQQGRNRIEVSARSGKEWKDDHAEEKDSYITADE